MNKDRVQTKTDWVADQLKAALRSGRLRPGERLKIRDWAERLGVSPTPVKEALKILETGGYLTIRPHSGASTILYSSKEFRELCRLRAALDGMAVELAHERLDDAGLHQLSAQMTRLNEQMAEALKKGRAAKAARLNSEFHMAIFHAADSDLLLRTVTPLWDRFPALVKTMYEGAVASEQVQANIFAGHQQIQRALGTRDTQAAIQHCRSHVEQAAARLASAIDALESQPGV